MFLDSHTAYKWNADLLLPIVFLLGSSHFLSVLPSSFIRCKLSDVKDHEVSEITPKNSLRLRKTPPLLRKMHVIGESLKEE